MKIKTISTVVVDMPLTRPHVMSLMTVKEVNYLFVRIEAENGLAGWGETSFLGGPTWSEESVESAQAIVNTYVGPFLIGKEAEEIEGLRHLMETLVRGNHFAQAAVELALWDLLGKLRGLPVYELLGGKVRDKVPLSFCHRRKTPPGSKISVRLSPRPGSGPTPTRVGIVLTPLRLFGFLKITTWTLWNSRCRKPIWTA